MRRVPSTTSLTHNATDHLVVWRVFRDQIYTPKTKMYRTRSSRRRANMNVTFSPGRSVTPPPHGVFTRRVWRSVRRCFRVNPFSAGKSHSLAERNEPFRSSAPPVRTHVFNVNVTFSLPSSRDNPVRIMYESPTAERVRFLKIPILLSISTRHAYVTTVYCRIDAHPIV